MDAEQLAQLLDRYAAPLKLYAAQWTDAPADVVQEAFLQLVRQPQPPDRVAPWLYRVVRNGAISAARSESRRKRREAEVARAAAAWFLPAEGGLDVEAATQALRELPLEQRETIVAHLWGELSFQQIGELTGVSSSTAHRRYEAGLTALRGRLEISWNTKSVSLNH